MNEIDLTTPNDDTLVSDLPAHIRAAKAAIDAAQFITVADIEVNLTTPDPVATHGIDIINIFAPYAQEVTNITNGADGDIMLFYAIDDNITFIHATNIIELKGDPALPDFPMLTGDMLILIFRESVWKELYRVI